MISMKTLRIERLESNVTHISKAVKDSDKHFNRKLDSIEKTLSAILDHLEMVPVDVPETPAHKKLVPAKKKP